MKASSSQTVDRMLGVLICVCASAVLVAIGSRAAPALSTILQLRFNGGEGTDSSDKKRRKRRRRQSDPDSYDNSSCGEETAAGEEEEREENYQDREDAYHAYAHGTRSAEKNAPGSKVVLHNGSCHCGDLVFEVEAPEHLAAIEGNSKVRYPFVTVAAERFRLISDDSNGTLYILKCRAPSGTEDVAKVSAHFFCRRCGVHVVHAPDFPHAAVADVNVHCIHPEKIKSLAVAFMRGGGAELPGMGVPVEGVFEVEGREFWTEALQERLRTALREPHNRSGSTVIVGGDSAAKSRPPKAVGGRPSASFSGVGKPRPALGLASVRPGVRDFVKRSPEMGALRRTAEERAWTRTLSRPASESAASASVNWGDVLMRVVSLPGGNSTVPSLAGGSDRESESSLVERDNASLSAVSGEDVSIVADDAGQAKILGDDDRLYWAPSDGSNSRNDSHSGRRALSVDSSIVTPGMVSSPGARGVVSHEGVEASGGERSRRGEDVGSGGAGVSQEESAVGSRQCDPVSTAVEGGLKTMHKKLSPRNVHDSVGTQHKQSGVDSSASPASATVQLPFVRPPSAHGVVSGGLAAMKA